MSFRINRLFFSLLAVCLPLSVEAEFDDIHRIYQQTPQLEQLEICHSGGCAKLSVVSLNDADLAPIKMLFQSPPQSASEERSKISTAIGLFEDIVGHKTGTYQDRAGTFNNADYAGQQDCNDEAINSTTYMRLLKQAGLMQFHEIEDLRTRNFFFTGWPHTTAVIRDVATKERFAVDSWFYDNGYPATIVPFDVWKANYFPEDSPIIHADNDRN